MSEPKSDAAMRPASSRHGSSRPGDETWDLWYPGAGATGLSFGRSVVAGEVAGDVVIVHACAQELDVEVRNATDGRLLAAGYRLARTAPGPMTFLHRSGGRIELHDRWPTPEDIGRLVLLPGGEAGLLVEWEHASDHSEWTWRVEFHNAVR